MSTAIMSSLLCLLAAAQVRPTQEPAVSPKVEKFLKLCERSRRGAILKIEHALRGLQRQPATRETKQRIADLEDQLSILRSNAKPVVPPLSFPPQDGAIGRLPGLSCHVDQVVSDSEMLVRCTFPVVVTTVRNFRARNESVAQPVRLMLRDVPAKKYDVGADVEIFDVFEVVGDETYRTANGGAKRVLVLKRFDMRAVEPYFRKASR